MKRNNALRADLTESFNKRLKNRNFALLLCSQLQIVGRSEGDLVLLNHQIIALHAQK